MTDVSKNDCIYDNHTLNVMNQFFDSQTLEWLNSIDNKRSRINGAVAFFSKAKYMIARLSIYSVTKYN